MVELRTNKSKTQIILMPNRSMSWQTNKKILFAIFMVNATIAACWAWMGAWLVLPFAGLEVMLVGLGMYYVSWKLSFKEVITIAAESLILEKGVYFPKQEWHWSRSATSLVKLPSHYRMSAPTLMLKHLNERIEIGSFLNRAEKVTLRKHLVELGLAT